ncbi:MAG: VWA domain-containing protein, partial [Chloroflexota bacterium]
MTKRNSPARQPQRSSRAVAVAIVIGILTLTAVCALVLLAVDRANQPQTTKPGRDVSLRVAYSPEKAEVFVKLVDGFNATRSKVGRTRVTVEGVSLAPKDMIGLAAEGSFQAVSPDSSIWLADMDRAWRAKTGGQADLVGETVRYMMSPVVIAMWTDVARGLGYPERDLGWADVLRAAQAEPPLRWSHPSTHTASGFLAALAQFYTAAGITRGLTEEAVRSPQVLEYVMRLERTVRHYGEGELQTMERVADNGRDYLDAFVVQEQLVVRYNQKHGAALVAIYPFEGALWEDHPLALLEHPGRTAEERQAFSLFRDYLLRSESQRLILQQGYRPRDLTISLSDPESPIRSDLGVDPSQPYTTMQIPGPSVIEVVKNVWLYAKRRANIYLVADVSSSMAGEKIADAQTALRAFLDQIESDQERVGLIAFASDVREVEPLGQLDRSRPALEAAVGN